jgi:hypothetical protein
MKRLTVILSIVIVLIFFLANCEKDVNGIPVKYYDNVTGEGYVFERHNDGTISPYTHHAPFLTGFPYVSIRADEKRNDQYIDETDNYYHIDHIEIDKNGKYICRFLEKKRPSVWASGEWKKMTFYTIWSDGFTSNQITYTYETIQKVAKKATKANPQIIPIDTIWVSW